jgi:hypothetical protein
VRVECQKLCRRFAVVRLQRQRQFGELLERQRILECEAAATCANSQGRITPQKTVPGGPNPQGLFMREERSTP